MRWDSTEEAGFLMDFFVQLRAPPWGPCKWNRGIGHGENALEIGGAWKQHQHLDKVAFEVGQPHEVS